MSKDGKTKRDALQDCLMKNNPRIEQDLYRNTKITLGELLDALSKSKYNLATELGYSAGGLAKLIKRFWPDKPKTTMKLCTYILDVHDICYCIGCDLVFSKECFYRNKNRKSSYCKTCSDNLTKPSQAHRTALYRASKIQATPKWADLEKIKEIYDNCPKGYHVDHIMPLNGVGICGLHVEYNLQYLPARENCSKGNRLELP